MACVTTDKTNRRKAICLFCNCEFLKNSVNEQRNYCSKACSNSGTKRDRVLLKCDWCQEDFEKHPGDLGKHNNFCSIPCGEAFKRGNSKMFITKSCKRCQKEYETLYRRQTEYCSVECSSLYQPSKEHVGYGKEGPTKGMKPWTFGLTKETDERIADLGNKVSKTQKEQFISGIRSNSMDNNPNWKNGLGVTPLHQSVRQMTKYKEWRLAVFKRDDFICIWCKDTSRNINADHIKAFSVILRENKISSIEEAEKCKELWDINNGRTLCVECHKTTETYGNSNKNKG